MDDDTQAYDVLIQFEAQEEIEEAYQWYETKRRGLGADFFRSLDERFAAIKIDPISYPVIYRQVRRVLLRRFPYSLFYMIEGRIVVVLACFHASRDPKQWQRRLDEFNNE